MDVKAYNKQAWDEQVNKNNAWTQPVSSALIEQAKAGNWQVVLTPHKAVPHNWFGKIKGKKVLCLASGGGQQGPILAAAGADVVVFDLSENQLKQDELVAKREQLNLKTVQGDMCDLSVFENESFDLVFHPCANGFIPDLTPLWQEASRVLKPGGRLLAGFLNPVAYIFDWFKAEQGEVCVRHKLPFSDLKNLTDAELKQLEQENEPVVFSHSLEQQIAQQLHQGLVLVDMFEDDWHSMAFSEYFPPAIATCAVKHTLSE